MPLEHVKTVMVVPYKFILPRNGGHKAAYGFCEFLAKQEDLVCISTLSNEISSETPFRVVTSFKDVLFKYLNPLLSLHFLSFFKKYEVKNCIIHQPFIGLTVLPAVKLLGVQLLVYVQNIEFQRFRTLGKLRWVLLYALEYFVYRSADKLLFISPDDRQPAIRIFGLNSDNCITVPYGVYQTTPPNSGNTVREKVIRKHQWREDDFLIIFLGPLTYLPNFEAVERIINEIEPRLSMHADFPYRFFICGDGSPQHHKQLANLTNQYVEYVGFVEDIERYIKAADVMINPVTSGGGIKTKIIEAIALGKTVVSAKSGAKGVDKTVCGSKLIEVADDDYEGFCDQLIRLRGNRETPTPSAFYESYYWGNIIERVTALL